MYERLTRLGCLLLLGAATWVPNPTRLSAIQTRPNIWQVTLGAHKAYWNSSYFGGSFRDLNAVSAR